MKAYNGKNSRNRCGMFVISNEVIENYSDAELKKIFADLVIVKCEHDYASFGFNYTAFSKHFKELQEYEIIPVYWCIIEQKESLTTGKRTTKVTWKEQVYGEAIGS